MTTRLRRLLNIFRAEEDGPPHITLADAVLWFTNETDLILIESDQDFAVPVDLTHHDNGLPTLALLDQLRAFLAQGNERELLTGLLDPVQHAGYDDRGFACIDICAYRVHSTPKRGDAGDISLRPQPLSERLTALSLSEKPVILHVPCDGITEGLLNALTQIERDLVSKLSAKSTA